MKSRTPKRKIVETAVGAALGAVIAGPIGAVAGGLTASKAASGLERLGERRRAAKRATSVARAPKVSARVKKILVPVDFSPPSLAAVRFAGKWATSFGAELCLLHVVEPISTSAPFGAEPVTVSLRTEDFPAQVTAALEKVALRECRGVAKVSAHLREGIAYDQIVAAAGTLNADIIIIATHGRSGLMRVLMGSTAERVVRHAPCPVLVVPSDAQRST